MTWRDGSWDVVYLGPNAALWVPLPGRVRDLKVKPKRKIQTSKEPETDNPHLKDEGYDGADVILVLELFKAAQWLELEAYIPDIWARQPGAQSIALDIRHPITKAFNVQQVFIKDIDTGMPQNGRLAVTFSMGEYFGPEKKKKTRGPGEGGGGTSGGGAAGNAGSAAGGAAGEAATDPVNPYGDGGGDFDNSTVPDPDPENLGPNFP